MARSLWFAKLTTVGLELFCLIILDMENYTFRLQSGQDLLENIDAFVIERQIEAGCILSGVGSLKHVRLRFANRKDSTEFDGYFEIVSITGTVSVHGSHVHISISNAEGATIGGHLVAGCEIYTTAEIVIAAFPNVIYKREFAEDSGYDELKVYKK